MESGRESAAVRYVRISWTQSRERSLTEIAQSIVPEVVGLEREKELEKRWRSKYPTLPSKGSALVQQLYRMRVREGRRSGLPIADEAEAGEVQSGAMSDSEPVEEPDRVSADPPKGK